MRLLTILQQIIKIKYEIVFYIIISCVSFFIYLFFSPNIHFNKMYSISKFSIRNWIVLIGIYSKSPKRKKKKDKCCTNQVKIIKKQCNSFNNIKLKNVWFFLLIFIPVTKIPRFFVAQKWKQKLYFVCAVCSFRLV